MRLVASLSSLLVISCVASTAGAADSSGYEPPMGSARTDFGAALSLCKGSLEGGPGKLSESTYQDYVEKRDRALKADPKLPSWDKQYLGFVPKELFPKCEKLVKDYVDGVDAEKKPTLLGPCENNTKQRLRSVIETYYPDFEKKGAAATTVWFARKDLEVARYTMYQTKGYRSQGGVCARNDPFKKAFAPLKEQFDKAEALVQKMEAAKGIKFGGVENGNHIVYIDLKTNQPVARSDQY